MDNSTNNKIDRMRLHNFYPTVKNGGVNNRIISDFKFQGNPKLYFI